MRTHKPAGYKLPTQVISANELRAAAQYGDDYYLIGFVDVGIESRWQSFVLVNPLPVLLENGNFDVDVSLQASAAAVFQPTPTASPSPNADSSSQSADATPEKLQ